jgi:hypothetical protein
MKNFFKWWFGINFTVIVFGLGFIIDGNHSLGLIVLWTTGWTSTIAATVCQNVYFHYHPEASKH